MMSSSQFQWQKMLQTPQHCDVVFLVEGQCRFLATKVVFAAASSFFTKNQYLQLEKAFITKHDINSGKVKGILSDFDEKTKGKRTCTVVKLSQEVIGKAFAHVLKLLYVGITSLSAKDAEVDIENVIRLSQIFELPQLEKICRNVIEDKEFLNPSIRALLNDETGKKLKEMFLNQNKLCDIMFDIEGMKVYAHKAVLSARSEVLGALCGDNFAEGSTYRLVVTISGLADTCVHLLLEDDEYDVIGLLLASQLHNATQLAKWCLHFISTNYSAFKKRKEFSHLKGENLDYVRENQWPPVSYLKEMKEYQKKIAGSSKKCSVM